MTKHGVCFKPEQIVSLFRQIEVLTANGKTLDEACKSLSITVQSHYRMRKMYGGMPLKGFPLVKADQAKKFKDLELENTRSLGGRNFLMRKKVLADSKITKIAVFDLNHFNLLLLLLAKNGSIPPSSLCVTPNWPAWIPFCVN